MRKRILAVALSAVVLAVLVLGLPLAIVVSHVLRSDQRNELERVALRAAASVSPSYRRGDLIELPPLQSGVQVGVYDRRGHRVTGVGPMRLGASTRAAFSGKVVDTWTGGQVVVGVPVGSAERVIAVVRSASPESAISRRIVLAWAGMAGLALFAAGCAGLFAAYQSRRLAQPITELGRVSHDLGSGDFSVRAKSSGVPEIDDAGRALNRTAERLEEMLERERSFAALASHQLRTPLTRLRLELETSLEAGETNLRTAAEGALTSAEQLSTTIDDVLALTRSAHPSESRLDVERLLADMRERWHGILAAADRPLRLKVEDLQKVHAPAPAVRQILNVLLDNAYQHGAGAVTIVVRDAAGAVAIDVIDEGKGLLNSSEPFALRTDQQHLGLPMARALAGASGGRILFARDESGTRFTLLLPVSGDHTASTTTEDNTSAV